MIISGSSILADPPAGAHIVYPYTDEESVVEAVALYTASGLRKGDAVILLMTAQHRARVESSLQAEGFDLARLKHGGQFVSEDAEQTLATFMVDSMPDESLFHAKIGAIVRGAKVGEGNTRRQVRAFGEMVCLLYGYNVPAALRLEELWNDVVKAENICLFCTYRLNGPNACLAGDLCQAHSHYVA